MQSSVIADDADEIPHATTQFIPVMGNQNFVVGIGHPARVPGCNMIGERRPPDFALDIPGGTEGDHETFEQGIAGHAIGTVQAGKAGLADGIEIAYIGFSTSIHDDTAAGVMCCGNHGNTLPGNVDAELETARVNSGEVSF